MSGRRTALAAQPALLVTVPPARGNRPLRPLKSRSPMWSVNPRQVPSAHSRRRSSWVSLLTGDNEGTGRAVAATVGTERVFDNVKPIGPTMSAVSRPKEGRRNGRGRSKTRLRPSPLPPSAIAIGARTDLAIDRLDRPLGSDPSKQSTEQGDHAKDEAESLLGVDLLSARIPACCRRPPPQHRP